jgi:hypothetical protein
MALLKKKNPVHPNPTSGMAIIQYWEDYETGGKLTSPPGTRLIIWRIPPALTHGKGFLASNNPVFFQVGLVPYNNDRHIFVILDANDLLTELRELIERAVACDGEDKKKSLTSFHV